MFIRDEKIKKYSIAAGFIGLVIWLLYFFSTLATATSASPAPEGGEWLIIIFYTILSFITPYFALKGVYKVFLKLDSRKIDLEFIKNSINLELDEFSEKLLENNFTAMSRNKFVNKIDEKIHISIELIENDLNNKKRIDFAFHFDPKNNYERMIKEIKSNCQKLSHEWDENSEMYITKFKTEENKNIFLWQSEDDSVKEEFNKRIITIADEGEFFYNS